MIEQMYKTTSDYPSVLTAKEIQQILGIGERQTYELLNPGQFHIVRVGKMIKVSKDVFLKWLQG
ncbi:Helix-turn-helix domain protein [compost metagenome]